MKLLETLLTGLLRAPLLNGVVAAGLRGFRRASANAMKRTARDTVRPRNWSNAELRKFAPFYDGAVINVSGWKDEDKTGGHYRDYFNAASAYTVSNYSGESGATGATGEIFLDLEGEVPEELMGRFQVAFNHTVLEHIYDIRKALANICRLSNDTVILVTPFLQQVHYAAGSYGDYWRPTPMCLERLLEEQGFTVTYQSCNDTEWYIVYVVTVATRHPDKYPQRTPVGKFADQTGVIHFDIN
ncbi:MAG: hypothetical protein EPO43_11425 [Rugosibacter sp.]|nr:MAG: hypothetical protein EPO43_11425 [Rugosibacter sp.]